MAKKVTIFFDGTWNDKTTGTNIYKMFDAYPGTAGNNPFQAYGIESLVKESNGDMAVYVSGIGTAGDSTIKAVQGMTGYGLERHVLIGYEFLYENLDQDDSLSIFGFSRGAATARILAHYLKEYGISEENMVGHKLEDTLVHLSPSTVGWIPQIAYLGLFDSVTAINTAPQLLKKMLGDIDIPLISKRSLRLQRRNWWNKMTDGIEDAANAVGDGFETAGKAVANVAVKGYKTVRGKLRKVRKFFRDISILFRSKLLVKYSDTFGDNVVQCSHAVAINEYRKGFAYSSIISPDIPSNPKYVEKYFLGSHSDIGGYADQTRSYIALQWILESGNLLTEFKSNIPANFDPKNYIRLPLFDSYRNPFGKMKIDTKFEKYLTPLYYRDIPLLSVDSSHSTLVSYSQEINSTPQACQDRKTISNLLSSTPPTGPAP